jgi:hypothetical protein
MLDCYICGKSLYICMMLFLYACFGGLPAREVDKIGNFVLKKIVCSSVKVPEEHKP